MLRDHDVSDLRLALRKDPVRPLTGPASASQPSRTASTTSVPLAPRRAASATSRSLSACASRSSPVHRGGVRSEYNEDVKPGQAGATLRYLDDLVVADDSGDVARHADDSRVVGAEVAVAVMGLADDPALEEVVADRAADW